MLCEGVVCDDGNECTNGMCDPATGTCDYTPVTDGTACDFGGLPGLCKAGKCVMRDTTHNLIWPIDCVPGEACSSWIGYPDIDGDGRAFDCGSPGYTGHQGTDIGMTWAQMDIGIDVLAAAPGQVLWVFDGKYDRCPNFDEPDCQPPSNPSSPGNAEGYRVCTELGDYCGQGTCCCYWCFAGGNVVVIRHTGVQGVFATRYDHFKKNSIVVTEGEFVAQGQKIGEAGSAGNSGGPHLHFEVWGTGFYELADPWAGPCGPNFGNTLWAFDPPWAAPGPVP
jgi:murein DD-endopeptidase MepM/ murein hydrolase activator NlpD